MMQMVVVTTVASANLQSNRHHKQTKVQLFTGRMSFLSPNQQCQSTEGNTFWLISFATITAAAVTTSTTTTIVELQKC